MTQYYYTNKIVFWILLIVYRFVLDFSYISFVVPNFSYEGYVLNFNLGVYLLSWVLFVPGIILAKDRLIKPSDYFFVTAILAVYAPLTSYYALTGFDPYPVVITIFSFYLIFIFDKLNFVKPIRLKSINSGGDSAFIISMICIVVLIFWYILSGAVGYFNLDFSKVYDYRKLSSELANVGPMSYFNGWVYNVFIVYAMAYTLLKKKYYITFLLVLIQIFFYGVSAHKTVFFTPFLVLSIWWYFRNFSSVVFMVLTFSFILTLSVFLFNYNNNLLFGSMFVRRVFFVPAKLTYDYFNFFEVNPRVYWSNSVLSWLMDYPYFDRITKIVSYANDSEASANNGYVSSGYAHAGLFGIVIYSYIIAFFLKNIDFLFRYNIPLWFILCLIVTPMRSFLISSDLPTSLLTHGFLLAFLLLLLSKNVEKSQL